jgi:mannitol/fructose-specific phosphotransferase system IIA component
MLAPETVANTFLGNGIAIAQGIAKACALSETG